MYSRFREIKDSADSLDRNWGDFRGAYASCYNNCQTCPVAGEIAGEQDLAEGLCYSRIQKREAPIHQQMVNDMRAALLAAGAQARQMGLQVDENGNVVAPDSK
jgi:hypothetical protein